MDANEMLVIVDKFIAEDTNPSEKDLFESSSYDEVLQVINDIQSTRESTKSMMNMKRIHLFLTGMEHFEKVMVKLKLDPQHVAKLMACVWGPTQFLLEVYMNPVIPFVLQTHQTNTIHHSLQSPGIENWTDY